MNKKHNKEIVGELQKELIREMRPLIENPTEANGTYNTAPIPSNQARLATNTAI